MNKLSHSAANIWMDCNYKYKLHYKQRLRSKTQSAALFFGTAIDKAISSMLENNDYKETFQKTWLTQELNGKTIDLRMNESIVFANSDYDDELLTNDDLLDLEPYNNSGFCSKEEISNIYQRKEEKGFEELSFHDKIFLNFANWLCLKRKGLIMLECVKKHILPNVIEVLSLQEKISLENSDKDEITGYIDLVCKWKDLKSPVIFDFKTATRQYESDAVRKSAQLALYTHARSKKYNTNTAGFIVLHKTIKKNRIKICSLCKHDGTGARHKTCSNETQGKRCNGAWIETINPEATFQILIDEIPAQIQNLIVENLDVINESIKTGIFSRNLNSCVKPYGPCIYRKLCWEGKDEELIQLDEKK